MAGVNGKEHNGELVCLLELPDSLSFKSLWGERKRNLSLFTKKFPGLSFIARGKKILAYKKNMEALGKKDAALEEKLEAFFLFLQDKLEREPTAEIDSEDIHEAMAFAEGIEAEEMAAKDSPVTSGRLTAEQARRLAGENEINLRRIAAKIGNIMLSVSGNAVVINGAQLSSLDPGSRLRLQVMVGALEAIILAGGKITEDNIEQASLNAVAAQNAALKGVAEVTKDGHQINRNEIFPEGLKDNQLFEPKIIIESCPDDKSFVPAHILTFTKTGSPIKGLLMSHQREHANRIRDKVGGALLSEDKMRLIVRAPAELAEVACDYVVRFANLLAEKGWKDKASVSQILSVVLGEADETTLVGKEGKKSLKRRKKSENPGEEIKDFFAELELNLYEGRTENQRRYLSILADDKYGLVLAQGPAGTGKTVLFLQTAMVKLRDHYKGVSGANFKKLILSYPLVNNGQKTGFLPGGVEGKTRGKFRTYYDHLVRLLAPKGKDGEPNELAGQERLDFLMENGIIAIELMEDMMGKSYPNALVVLDEAQNSESEQMISLLTRPEETSRLFVSGDVEQCYLGARKGRKERYDVPSTVHIDDAGMVYIKKNGRPMPLGHHLNVGEFTTNRGCLEYVTPYNGFVEAFLLYSDLPGVACGLLEHKDIQRATLARSILEVRRALRDASYEVTGVMPKGNGSRCVQTVLEECEAARLSAQQPDRPNKTAVGGGTVIQLHKS